MQLLTSHPHPPPTPKLLLPAQGAAMALTLGDTTPQQPKNIGVLSGLCFSENQNRAHTSPYEEN